MTYLDKKWSWRLFYTVTPASMTVLPHELRLYLNVTDGGDVGAEFADFLVDPRAGASISLTTYTDTLMDLLELLWGATAQFIRAELWAADVGSEDWIFYSVLPIGHAGGSVSANVGNNGQIITFRCMNGNSMRIQLAETTLAAAPKDPYPFSHTASANLAAHIISTDSCIVNKRFAFPIAPINNCVEQNEAYWDARNR